VDKLLDSYGIGSHPMSSEPLQLLGRVKNWLSLLHLGQ